MGFCLLKEKQEPGLYAAVNPAHVLDVVEHEDAVRLVFGPKQFLDVQGYLETVQALLAQATKIGMQKLEIHAMAKRDSKKPTKTLLNHADRMMVVREIAPSDLPEDRSPEIMTMSEALMEDGRTQYMAERPGVVAMRANKAGRVPGV